MERIKRFNAEHPYSSFVGEKARYHNKYQGSPEDYSQHIEEYGENSKYVSSGSGTVYSDPISNGQGQLHCWFQIIDKLYLN
ncbi:hypothetical protein [Streptococcus pantholopis]|uniref:Uncharacterized protein n=1 Tax=Streptococcus pantholopis TaxID=1811193 RepID=A0A172Q5R9_9STRE|nr:hypothetical protein [Streptococcus pantholopis]AND78794.1 hypothetical protein A0O21_01470 [Streptococcus pantholopis]